MSQPAAVQPKRSGRARGARPAIRWAGAAHRARSERDRQEAEHAASRDAAIWAERERLARELYESVSQLLFAVDMATYSALTNFEKNPPRARERLQLAQDLNKSAQTEMRALIHELRSDTLGLDGLAAALEDAIAALKDRYRLDLSYQLCPEPKVSLDVKESFNRVAVEALNNAGRHASGAPVGLTLCSDGDALVLEVVDEGPGFDSRRGYSGCLGLRFMQDRAAGIGATLTVQSVAGVGTTLRMVYPLQSTPES